MSHPDMTASLSYNLIAYLLEYLDSAVSRNYRQLRTHLVMLTVSIRVFDGSGISSPMASMSSRQSNMASFIFVRASSIVSP